MEEKVILVDPQDKELGVMGKMEAHKKALLHRAVSVFIFNSKGQWLLQQRAKEKYHSNSLWSNTACTHPSPGESYLQAANRRLKEEMGLEANLKDVFNFIYNEPLDGDLTEHELDHVFIGYSDVLPQINTREVMNYKYISYEEMSKDIARHPDKYTVWFRKIVDKVNNHI